MGSSILATLPSFLPSILDVNQLADGALTFWEFLHFS